MIKLNNFKFNYNKELGLNLDLNFEKSKAYAILGKNEAGKTSIINCIRGIYKGTGDISVNDEKEHDKFSKHISCMNLEPKKTFFKSVLRYINDFITLNNDVDKDYIVKQIEYFDIDIFSTKNTLSKGMSRILEIILTLSRNTDFYIFDEPFYAIDQINKESVLNLILEKSQNNKSIILSTHDLDLISTHFDEYIFIKGLKVIKQVKQTNIETLSNTFCELLEEGEKDD